MKRLICMALIAASMFSCAALAQYDDPVWQIFKPGATFTADFDNDEKEETASFSCELNEYEDGSFTLTVGDKSVTVNDCICLEPTMYAMKAGYTWYYYGTLFMVNEYGPSDDPLTYCFLYTMGELIDVGMIPALVENFDVSSSGVITTSVRANMIGTWSRPADYVLATGIEVTDEDWKEVYRISEAPRAVYPMGMVVTLKTDLPVSASVYSLEQTGVLKAGSKVVLAASDDASRLYVTDYSEEIKGWVGMKHVDWQDYILVNGKYLEVDDVFDNIFYAD